MNIPVADAGVAVLGNGLVGLVGSVRSGSVNLVRDEVAGLLDGIHFDCWLGCVGKKLV